ncbi:replication protein A 32 kDa subunit A [Quillaja saponaria]|uniref:Replication protein A 32 kDa subunit A n=1 Tax=Quillaja saponaria TaxID=32244 RepID=A0AAD7PK73_QUISA|nr:replication protein A 32 kDa subunit A [Quillaja saponaria]
MPPLAFSGGGFTASQSTQFNDSTPSPAKVTMVGMVFAKAGRTTDVGFFLDDGTGQIGCRRWVNETIDTKEMDEIQNGMYIRVCGHLKSFQGVRQLVAFSVRLLTNFDEISFHFIACIHNHLQSKLRSEGAGPTQTPSSDSSLHTPVRNGSNGYQPPSSNTLYGQYSLDGLKDCDKLVLDYLQQHSDMEDERGIHVDELSRELKLSQEKIMLSLKTLGDDGLVYSTIDDFHYKQA